MKNNLHVCKIWNKHRKNINGTAVYSIVSPGLFHSFISMNQKSKTGQNSNNNNMIQIVSNKVRNNI